MPMPLTARGYRLKAQQNRGEWRQTAQLRESYEQLMQDPGCNSTEAGFGERSPAY